MKALILLFWISQPVFAQDDKPNWVCADEAGYRNDNVITSCGVGEAPTESLARLNALNAALEEFKTICNFTADCSPDRISTEPKRLTCVDFHGHYKCYRMIQITLLPLKEKK